LARRKLLLVNPTHRDVPNASWIKYYDMPPMGLAYLAALTPENSWDIELVDENYDELDPDAAPDLVGITSLTYNVNRAYEVASHFRKRGSRVVLGGIHATMRPDEAGLFADSVVCGEAENVWGQVLADFERGTLKPRYDGAPADLEDLVIPRRDLFAHPVERHAMVTSRGCPLNCEFCSVTAFNGSRYRRRPVARVLDELSTIPSRYVTFMDDNFGGVTERDFAETRELLRGMIDCGLGLKWGTQAGMNYADDAELLELTARSGCIALFIGIESVSPASLTGSARKGKLVRNPDRVREAVGRLHDHGIAVVGAFVLGNDEDDRDIFDRTVDFVFETRLDACNLTISTPYPGTRLFNRIEAEGRLLYRDFPRDWKNFNFVNATYRPKKMSVDDLQRGYFRVIDETTDLGSSLLRGWRTLVCSRSALSTLACFHWNRGYHRVSGILQRGRVAGASRTRLPPPGFVRQDAETEPGGTA
jgi:radical SAM superfamily enzyme YgiQ (UPF0313 family)